MREINHTTSGVSLVLVFVLIASFRDVYLGGQFQKVDPILLLVISFLITFTFFTCLQLQKWRTYTKYLRSEFRSILALNVTTAMSWLGLFLALRRLEPAIVNTICYSLGPIIGTVFWKFFRPEQPLLPFEKWAAIGVGSGLLIVMSSSRLGFSGIGLISNRDWTIGTLSAIVSALGVMGNTLFSKRLSDAGASTDTVMAFRFPLLIMVGSLLLPKSAILAGSHLLLISSTVVFTFLTIILPLFILQKGIERSEPITVSLLLASIPVFTFFIQLFDSRIYPSFYTLSGIFFCVLFASAGILFKIRSEVEFA